ncbi:extracellular solute-binding protein [Eubacterium sp. am_0171]|uniref:Putative ABC transporter substrate-binding protein yesO n=1 Tax=Faecalicatena contorta TaxID=39482 RepID=A0A173YPL9_9FIRM|nr:MULTISPECIES: extracellular solute-binding protein [Clostridia]MSC83064.1 extracellular solute-binding protein [Eubacterium sp. BIOML-A1]MSD05350.1 extracellular solute-binding protein [Eubacterium sp. BIOML-A2]RYT24811.1 extracellular solute-binding protein [Eubacterium sp. am_0171]CUN65824.1 Putative ABC transporter substrate-binding protein yesO [[Eubacterium] contortum] [Faecalicatena contorta]
MKKRTLKKLLSAVMAGTMAVGLLAGCSGGKEPEPKAESEGGATTIKFGIHVANPQEQEAVTYNIVQAFNEKYDGKYKVEFEASDKESHSKNMKLEASDGTLPQIFWLDASEAPEYSDSGVLMDLSDFLSENSDIQTALGGMENAFQDDNGQYGLPYQCNVQGIFYNKDLFDKAGIEYPTNDTTYEEFIEMIKKLKESGVTPLSIGSKNSAYAMWEFNETLARYGWAENIDSILSGEKKFNNEDLNACFEKLKGIADAGAFPENMATIEYFDAKQLFIEGKAAMFGTGQWDCAEFDENIGEKVGFWWGPKFTDTNYNQDIAMKVPSAPIVVNAEVADDDAVKEAVYEFLKFYYGEDAAKISYEGSIFPATNYSEVAATDTQYSMNAMLEALAAGWESPEAAPDLTVVSAVQEALYNSMFGVMQGTYEPSEALDKIDEALSYSK